MKVLFIDDEVGFLDQARIFLEKISDDIDVFPCISAKDAVERLEKEEFDIVVSDYQMPEMDGLDLLKMLRELGNDIPFIVFTGKGREEVAMKALNLGASRYLQKGGDPKSQYVVLAQAIKQEVEHRKTQVELELHKTLMEASIDGIAILDSDWFYLHINKAYAQMYGYRNPDELLGTDWFEQYSEKRLKRFQDEVLPKIDKNSHWRGEAIGKRKDGSAFPQEISLTQIEGNMICIVRDISERKKMEEELRNERDKAKRYLDVAGAIVVALDENQLVTLINRQGQKMLGYELEEILNRNWYDYFVPGDVREEVRATHKKLMSGCVESVQLFENPILTSSGEERIISWHNTVLRDKNGEIAGTLSSGQDITEKKRIERELYKERNFLKQIAETSPACITKVDKEGNIIFANKKAEEVLGLVKDDIKKRTYDDLDWNITDYEGGPYPKENLPFNLVQERGEPVYNIRHAIEVNGERRLLMVNAAPLYVDGGFEGMVSVIEDVTEEERLRKKLKEREEFFRELIEGVPDLIYRVNLEPELGFEYVNQAATKITGFTPEEHYANPCLGMEIVHEEDSDKLRVLQDGDGLFEEPIELRWMKKDGDIIWTEQINVPIYDEDGELVAIEGIARDITKRKEMEDKKEFLQSLFQHDLRNKTQVIYGYLQLLEDTGVTEDQNRLIEKTLKISIDCLDIVGKVTQLKELDDYHGTKSVNFKKIIESTIKYFKDEAEEKGIALEVEFEDVNVKGGRLLIEVFYNLIGNSIKHSKGSMVRISTDEEGNDIVVVIEDNGKGISDDIKEKIFKRGFSFGEESGSGLGLYLVKEILDKYEGSISVKDSKLGGALFEVRLDKAS